ncbi:MAG TPA: TIGR03435 family protein [Verrucomicrobiae bacterium]|nr:TIGR03435 family protein [Verrucomicrobiae bacterium]
MWLHLMFLFLAQTPEAASRPLFDVVSIKPTPGQPMNSGFRRASPGVLNATNVSLRFLIEYAYDVRDDQISGGSAWMDSERYEVLAKPPGDGDPREDARLIRQRTQSLLVDRFHLAFHRETKELPVYVLLVAKNGPKGLREPSQAVTDSVNNGRHLNCQHVSMAVFARQFLANQIGRSVTDATGIEGNFDFTLDWSPDDAPAGASPAGGTAPQQFPPLVLALQEQLGLKLEQRKGPVEVLVIDRAERPAEN